MKSESGARWGLIALILLLVAVVVVLVIGLVPLVADLPRASEPDAVRQEVTSTVSLEDAGARARERAEAWSADAVLVRVESSWYVVPGWQGMALPPLAWGFLFYSPSEGTLATVVVGDTELLWVPQVEIPVVPIAIETFPPAYAPHLVWVTFLAAGGEAFVRDHPRAQVTFRLQPGDDGVMWTVSAFQEDAGVEVSLDAHSGIVTAREEK